MRYEFMMGREPISGRDGVDAFKALGFCMTLGLRSKNPTLRRWTRDKQRYVRPNSTVSLVFLRL